MVTITRKIQLIILDEDVKGVFTKLYDWNEKVFRSANYVASHHYFLQNMAEMSYLNDDVKLKLADGQKTEGGVLNTSRTNSTYRVLSAKFKGDTPTAMLSAVNNQVVKNFTKESKEYFSGKRSLRTYKRTIPMPVPAANFRNFAVMDDGNYSFDVFSISFKTFFGRDLSGNKIIMDRAITGEYKFCDSSIQMDGKKIFLLAVFQFVPDKFNLDAEQEMHAELDINIPIVVQVNKKRLEIGNKEEYLHRRLSIQHALRRAQVSSRFNKGGKGRAKKMQAIEHFKEVEKNYIKTRLHGYSKKLIDLCLSNKCGKLVLVEMKEKEEEAKADKLLLRNWGYYGLKEMIKYKANRVGIEVVEK